MADDTRIEELRRRVRKDPASLAFAQLAEELRRARRFMEAVAVCRAGLEMYPGYLSARVTLGRCFIDLNRLDDAEKEIEKVREVAPENLVAIRALAEVRERRNAGTVLTAEVRPQPAPSAPFPAPLRPIWGQASADRVVEGPDVTYDGATFEVRPKPDAAYGEDTVRTLAALEAWLDAIHVTRASRSA
jgi:tetratricopeptide (TPR) repeat protein